MRKRLHDHGHLAKYEFLDILGINERTKIPSTAKRYASGDATVLITEKQEPERIIRSCYP